MCSQTAFSGLNVTQSLWIVLLQQKFVVSSTTLFWKVTVIVHLEHNKLLLKMNGWNGFKQHYLKVNHTISSFKAVTCTTLSVLTLHSAHCWQWSLILLRIFKLFTAAKINALWVPVLEPYRWYEYATHTNRGTRRICVQPWTS